MLTDVGVSPIIWFRSDLGVSAWVQHERWLLPVIQANPANDVTAAVASPIQPRSFSTMPPNLEDLSGLEGTPNSKGGHFWPPLFELSTVK